jgi:hypothetical protein
MPQGPLAAAIARSFQKALGFAQLDQQGALWDSQRHGKYYAQTYGTPAISPTTAAKAGAAFRCANQAAVTLNPVLGAIPTSYTGLCLSNPVGSGVILALGRVAAIFSSAVSGNVGVGVITGWSAAGIIAHGTSLNANILANYVGAAPSNGSVVGPASVANVDSACTLVGTPTWAGWAGCSAVSGNTPSMFVDIDGDFIVPPGGYIAIGATASQGGFLGMFTWEELPP